MKLSTMWTLSMLFFAGAVFAQGEAEGDAPVLGADETAEPVVEEPVDETPDIVENPEGEGKKTKTFEPAGALTRDYQYIFDQGTVSFDGFNIVDENNYSKNVGRLDGQTGWTGVNQAGDKTMSYQVAFVIKADDSLRRIFNPVGTGRRDNQTTQLGWWIPTRGEDIPPEDYTMMLLDVNLYPTITTSNIRVLQTIFKKGLYDKPTSRIDVPYNLPSSQDSQKLEEIWKFDANSGKLNSVEATGDSLMPQSDYFVPIMDKTRITDDMMVLAIEGTSLKQKLPEVRWGSKVPFTFQILDFNPDTKAQIIRQ